jgi:hypothetical protein
MPYKDKDVSNQYKQQRRKELLELGLCHRDKQPLAVINGVTQTLCEECRKKKQIIEGRPKLIVLEHYGKYCQMCGETNAVFLTLDHLLDGGNQHRETLRKFGRPFYQWLIKSDFPSDYQVLCFNCNCGRKQELKTNSESRSTKLKLEVCDAYGGRKCVCCGETKYCCLTIDHINGGGELHRKSVGHFYSWIKRNNFPPGFQVLCWNCNLAKRYNQVCPHQIKKSEINKP